MAGCIVEPVYADGVAHMLQDWVRKGFPVIMIDRYIPGIATDLVASDHFSGGYAAVSHLIQQGYRDILYLARQPLQLTSVGERLHGYRAAMADAGLTPRSPFAIEGTTETSLIQSLGTLNESEREVVGAIAGLLSSRARPEAIVAMNDLLALLVLEAANTFGLRVPDELAVVGFDDMDFAASCQPPLTTVAQQSYQLGVEAASLLLQRIDGEDGPPRQIRLPTQLVVRGSSQYSRAVHVSALAG